MNGYRPSNETPEQHLKHESFLLYSKCSGYMLAKASFDYEGVFDTFLCSSAGVIMSVLPDEYESWTTLDKYPALVATV